MTFRRYLRAIAVGGLVFSALTMNSGSAGAVSAKKFRTAADKICTALAEDYVEVTQRNGLPQSLEEEAAGVEEVIPLFKDAQEKLAKLKPPKNLKADYKEYLSLREDRIANDEAFLESAANNDQAAIQENVAALSATRSQYEALGEDLGFYACAERLHKKEAQKVRDVVEETWTNGDPAFCTEKYTEEFVEVYAGGPDGCVAAESDPANAVSSIDIEFVKGVDKVRATVRFTPSDGPDAGRTLETDLIYEDGIYKRNAIYAG
jgi:hypothetical protein